MTSAILSYVLPGDPTELFELEKELAVGSFGTVYAVRFFFLYDLISRDSVSRKEFTEHAN